MWSSLKGRCRTAKCNIDAKCNITFCVNITFCGLTDGEDCVHEGEDWPLCSSRGRLAYLFVKGKTGVFVHDGDWHLCS